MKTKKHIVFAIIISAIYSITVLTYAASLFMEYNDGPAIAAERFNDLQRETALNLKANDPDADGFKDSMLSAIGAISDLAGIKIEYQNRIILSYPAEFSSSLSSTSPLITVKNTTLNAREGGPVSLTAAIYLLKPSSVYAKGRAAFLVLLATTLACVGGLVYLYIRFARSPEDAAPQPDDGGHSFEAAEEDEAGEKQEPVPPAPEPAPAATREGSPSLEEPSADLLAQAEEDLQQGPVPAAEAPAAEEPPEAPVIPAPAEASAPEEPPAPPARATPPSMEDLAAAAASDEPTPIGISLADFEAAVAKAHEERGGTPPSEPLPAAEQPDTPVPPSAEELPRPAAVPEPEPEPGQASANDFTGPSSSNIITQEEFRALTSGLLPEEPAQPEEPAPESPQERPQGLFSPVTGFGWEAYMLPRLDSELVRAASSEQDLALFTIRIPQLDWQGEAAKDICSLIIETAKFQDLVFEYKSDGCTAIFQNIDIDRGLAVAEDLHTTIIARLAKHGIYSPVAIGISARSLRLISGARLANESEQALLHAQEDKDSPIIAFKVNPEKYRNYLASETAKINAVDEEPPIAAGQAT